MNAIQKLSGFISGMEYGTLDYKTIEYVKVLFADYLAAAVSGKKVNVVFNKAVEDIIPAMGGAEESRYLFGKKKIPAVNAAFMNAAYCHGADIDDGHRGLMGHPGAPVISAVLSLAEKENKTGEDVITAIVAGYEVCIRLGRAVQPELVNRGFHSTGIAGATGAAAACSVLLKFNEVETENALALAMTQASGLLMVAESGQMSKPINPARAAQSGILAAMLAAKGVEGSKNSLESKKGFIHAYSGAVNADVIVEGLGQSFAINGSYIKPYPSCRHTHGVINAAESLFEKYTSPNEIDSIDAYIYPHAIAIAGQILEPACIDDAKFSIHYALACSLYNGTFRIDDLMFYEDRLDEIKDLIGAIQLISDESLENQEEHIRGSRVRINMKNGISYEKEILLPKGDPEDPLNWKDIKNKMKNSCADVMSGELQEELLEKVKTLEELDSISGIMEIMSNM